jgi:hypothetical protein
VRGSTPQISPGRKSFNSVVNQSVLGLGVRSVKQLSVKTRPGRLFINIVRKPCVKVSIRATARKQSAKHLGRIPQNIGRQSLHWAHATNAPVSIGHWSLLRLSARTEALRPSLKKGPRSAIFIQWERSSQTRLHSLSISGSSFIIRSFISATKFDMRCGNRNHGIRISGKIITQSAKVQQHHRSTTTKIQVGVLENILRCLFVGFRVDSPYNSSHFSR